MTKKEELLKVLNDLEMLYHSFYDLTKEYTKIVYSYFNIEANEDTINIRSNKNDIMFARIYRKNDRPFYYNCSALYIEGIADNLFFYEGNLYLSNGSNEELELLFKLVPENKDLLFPLSTRIEIALTYEELLKIGSFMGNKDIVIDLYDLPSIVEHY
ncbi:hypothetical protein XaC1_96 [Xanthomonas phage XaC1]|nr:hypothetical protein XaC1_96 [Xanthomonas phage XaC1]